MGTWTESELREREYEEGLQRNEKTVGNALKGRGSVEGEDRRGERDLVIDPNHPCCRFQEETEGK